MLASSVQLAAASQVLQQEALTQQTTRVIIHPAQHLLNGLPILGIDPRRLPVAHPAAGRLWPF
jgi:hypothetical protein